MVLKVFGFEVVGILFVLRVFDAITFFLWEISMRLRIYVIPKIGIIIILTSDPLLLHYYFNGCYHNVASEIQEMPSGNKKMIDFNEYLRINYLEGMHIQQSYKITE